MMFSNLYEIIKRFIKENLLFTILLALILAMPFIKIPYQVEMPGGVIDLGNRVQVNGEATEIKGSFNMAYVSVVQGSIPHVILGLIIPDWEIVKTSDIVASNETVTDANRRDRIYLEQSIDMAKIAAFDAAEIEYELTDVKYNVAYLSEEADTDIKIGDVVISCDGKEVKDIEDIRNTVKSKKAGDKVDFTVIRSNKEEKASGKIYEEDGELYVGISVIETFKFKSDTEVEISSKASESGPSGGLMMALMTYTALSKQDLTNGKTIVGTGTISKDGTVGPIGGVKYKIMGAAKAKADVFLVPKDNYEEALKVKEEKNYDIELVSVETLKDAIEYLERK